VRVNHDGGIRFLLIDSKGQHTLGEEVLTGTITKQLAYDISAWSGKEVTLEVQTFGAGTDDSNCIGSSHGCGSCCGEYIGIDWVKCSSFNPITTPKVGTQCAPVELTQGVIRSPDDYTAYVEFKVTNARALSYINIHVSQGKIDYVAHVKENKIDPLTQLFADALELEFSLAQEFIPDSGTAFTGIDIILNRLNPEGKDSQNYMLTSPSSGTWVIKMEGTQARSPNAEISVAYDPAYCDQSVSSINGGSLSYYSLETDMLQNIIDVNQAEISFPYSVKNLDRSDYTGGGIEVSPELKLGNANYFEIKVTQDRLPDIIIRTQSDAKVDYVCKIEETSEGKRLDDLRNLGFSAVLDLLPGSGTVYTGLKILVRWLPSSK